MQSDTNFTTAHSISKLIHNDISQNENTLVVFDLDSTLFSVQPRTQRILQDFLQQKDIQSQYSNLIQQFSEIEIQESDWGILTALRRSEVAAPIEFFEKLRNFWKFHFFTNDYLKFDKIYKNANLYVNQLQQAGASISYLTGRNQVNMKEGTENSLKTYGFPLESLFMKPKKEFEDVSFKLNELQNLKQKYSKIWFFENEPVILNAAQKTHPDIQLIWVDSTHSRREEIKNISYKIKPDYTEPKIK